MQLVPRELCGRRIPRKVVEKKSVVPRLGEFGTSLAQFPKNCVVREVLGRMCASAIAVIRNRPRCGSVFYAGLAQVVCWTLPNVIFHFVAGAYILMGLMPLVVRLNGDARYSAASTRRSLSHFTRRSRPDRGLVLGDCRPWV